MDTVEHLETKEPDVCKDHRISRSANISQKADGLISHRLGVGVDQNRAIKDSKY